MSLSLARIKLGELDLALVYQYDFVLLQRTTPSRRTHLLDDPIRVVLPQGHRAARRRAVRLDELAGEDLDLLHRALVVPRVRRRGRAETPGFEPDIGFESDDHGVWQGLVAAGVGVALAPELALETLYPESRHGRLRSAR